MIKMNTIRISSLALIAAFDGGKAGWKVDADGNLVKDAEGNPIYVDTNGGEKSVGSTTISTLNAEAKKHRTTAETLQAELAKFEGLNADEAKAAIAKLKDVDLDKMVNAGKLDEVRAEVTKTLQAKIDEANKRGDTLQSELDTTRIGYAFSSSKTIADKLAIPAPLVQSHFGNAFKFENGKLIAKGPDGNPLYSQTKAGELAEFDEAVMMLVEQSPFKGSLLKGDNQQGSGGNNNGGNQGGGKTMKRSQFDQLSVPEQAAITRKGEMTIVD